jgi:hypothetical protein
MENKSEHLEQAEFVQWMKRTYPEHKIFAIPNGGMRSKAVAMKLKVEGVMRGVPDLFIPSLRLFVEMKKQKGFTVSPEQQEWIDYLNNVGYTAQVCNGKDSAIELVESLVNK